MLKYLLIGLICLSFSACSTQAERSRDAFYTDMEKAQVAMENVQSLVNSNKFAKVRYSERVGRMVPTAQRALKKYQDTPQAQDPAYLQLKKAFEHYVMADHLWKQDKGLVMVNQRLADAESALKRADRILEESK